MSTDAGDADSRGDTYIGFDVSPEDKQRIRVRAAQLGYNGMAGYVRDLVLDDIDDAEIPL